MGSIDVFLTIFLICDFRLCVYDLLIDLGGVSMFTLNIVFDVGVSGWILFNKELTLKDGEFWYV